MTEIVHRVEHNLSDEQARQLAERVFEEHAQRYARYAPAMHWIDARQARVSFTVTGQQIDVLCRLLPGALELRTEVPWPLRLFARPATRLVDAEVRRRVREWKHGPGAKQR